MQPIFTPEDKMTGGSHLDVNTSALVGVWSLGGKQSKCKLRMVDAFRISKKKKMKQTIIKRLFTFVFFALLPMCVIAQEWDYDGGNEYCGSRTLNRGEKITIESAEIANIYGKFTNVTVFWDVSDGFAYSKNGNSAVVITGYGVCYNAKLVARVYYTQTYEGRTSKWKRSYTWDITVKEPQVEKVERIVELSTPGTLSGRISSSDKNKITHLTIIGEINGTDLRFLREMAGSNYNREFVNGSLQVLDLREATIKKGGDAYVMVYSEERTCMMDNVIPSYAFFGCSKLKEIYLPNSVSTFETGAFQHVALLEKVDMPNNLLYIYNQNFTYCYNLRSLTIPKKVKSITSNFESSKNLTTIYCYATNPPSMSKSFSNTNINNGSLYVPEGSRDAYLAANGWMGFGKIYDTLPPNPIIAINSVNFPDSNFRDYLFSLESGKDGVFTDAELSNIFSINVNTKEIMSLKVGCPI